MAVHMIALFSPPDSPQTQKVVRQIEKEYPGYYPLVKGQTYLVSSPDVATVINGKIGLNTQEAKDPQALATGMVVKVNGSYSGYAHAAIWEWMKEAAEA